MSKQADQLVLKDPARLRLFGGLFIVAGLVMVAIDRSTLYWMLFDGIFIAAGLVMELSSSSLLIVADRAARTLNLRYDFLLFHTSRSIPFDDIADIQALLSRGTFTRESSRRVYRLVAVLKDGRVMAFRRYFTGNAQQTQLARRLRLFITGQERSTMPAVPGPVATLSI